MDIDRLFIAANFKGEIVVETLDYGNRIRIIHTWDAHAPNDLNDAPGAVVTRIEPIGRSVKAGESSPGIQINSQSPPGGYGGV